MPFVRVTLPQGRTAPEKQAIADAIYEAMRATINIPEHDRFIVLGEHAPDTVFFDASFLGVERSAEALAVEITLRGGRTDEMKQALYRNIVDRLHASIGVRREDILIVLCENGLADWSFGNGVAQYLQS